MTNPDHAALREFAAPEDIGTFTIGAKRFTARTLSAREALVFTDLHADDTERTTRERMFEAAEAVARVLAPREINPSDPPVSGDWLLDNIEVTSLGALIAFVQNPRAPTPTEAPEGAEVAEGDADPN
jgi:hypothetical protein